MRDLLRQFEDSIRAKGFNVDNYLQAGISAATVNKLFAETGRPLPSALLDLYTWKNGTAKQSPAEFRSYYEALDRGNQNVVWPDHAKEPLYGYRNTPFFPEFGAFLPLQDAHSAYQEAREHDFWPANFWPMFHDDAILMDIDPASATFGQVHLWSPSLLILEPELYYDSLETMFTTYIAALDANFIPFGDELEPNFSNYGALAAQLNPLSAPTSWRS